MTGGFQPKFVITNGITSYLTMIERARGFPEAAELSDDWIRSMSDRALVLEVHHTTLRISKEHSLPGIKPNVCWLERMY